MATQGRRGGLREVLGRLAGPAAPKRMYVHLGSYGCRYGEMADPGEGRTEPARLASSTRHVEVVEAVDPSGIREVDGDRVLEAIRSAGAGPRLGTLCLISGSALLAIAAVAALNSWGVVATTSLLAGLAALLLWPWADRRDRDDRRVEIHYVLDPVGERVCEGLHALFDHLRTTDSIWSVRTRHEHGDWKRNAGATVAVDRAGAKVDFAAPPDVVTNVRVGRLILGSGRGTLYFFPDRLILLSGGEARSVPYPSLAFENRQVRFVEEDRVPADAEVVGHTWRFVNKDGSPDRRFNDNRRLPIAVYGEVEVDSAAGLRFALQMSSPHIAAATPRAFSVIVAAIRQTEHAAAWSPLPAPPPETLAPEAIHPASRLAGMLATARDRSVRILSCAWAERLPDWLQPIVWGLCLGGPVAGTLAWAFSGRPSGWAAPLAAATSAGLLMAASLVVAQVRSSARTRRERRQDELEGRRSAFREILTRELKGTPIGRFDFPGLIARAGVAPSEAEVVADELYARVAERVMADGVVTAEERGKLDSLARVLRVESGRASRIELLAKEDRYRRAVEVAAEDGIFTAEEVRDLDELRCSLGLADEHASLPAIGLIAIDLDDPSEPGGDSPGVDRVGRRGSRTRIVAAACLMIGMIGTYPAFRSLSAPSRPPAVEVGLTPPVAQPLAAVADSLPAVETPPPAETYLVSRVVDGDTVEVVIDDKPVKVRLIGVDTPETVHPSKPVERFGKEASAFTKERLAGKSVTLEYEPGSKLDKYGRTLAYLRDGDGLDINREIIARGFGHAYTRFPFSRMEDYRAAEREAREAKAGLWGPDGGADDTQVADVPRPAGEAATDSVAPPPPATAEAATVYITNTGAKYHRAGCRYLAKSSIASSLAEVAGKYGPCSKCHPPTPSGDQLAGKSEGPPTTPAPSPSASSGSMGTTPRGFQLQVGPRGGVYHYSKNGKKVYEKKR